MRFFAALVMVIGLGAEGESMAKESLWNVLDYGAVADGETDNTETFQKASDTS